MKSYLSWLLSPRAAKVFFMFGFNSNPKTQETGCDQVFALAHEFDD